MHRPVPGFPGYTVTDDGEVWSHWRSNGRKPRVRTTEPHHRLSPGIAGSNGYEQVWLFRDGRRHGRFVHLLVLETFVGPCPEAQQARHLDGNQRHNHVGNLAWGTPVENAADRERHGRTARGERVGTCVLTDAEVATIRASHPAASIHSLSRRFTISRRQIGRILRGESR